MKRKVIIPLTLLLILTIIFLGSGAFRTKDAGDGVVEVLSRPFEVWSVYEGNLEARSLQNIMSTARGAATIEEIASEGAAVKEGDVLVRFDASDVERTSLDLDRDYALATAELESLENAQLPLELRELETRLMDARIQSAAEAQFLKDSHELRAEDLISEQEVKQQEVKTEAAETLVKNLELQLELTKKFLHPSTLERARATLDAAEQRRKLAQEKLDSCAVKAPVDGTVVYSKVHVGGEYRTPRVGDTIYRNQSLMVLPDMSDPVVQCNVPEAELSRVGVGNSVVVVPIAYPDLRLAGEVESVGSMAQNIAGRPGWQKYFLVLIKLNEVDERLRSGMSVRANILSYANSETTVIPRMAVRWDEETPYCEVQRGRHVNRQNLVLGMANDQFFEVLDGLNAGDRVTTR